MCLSSLQHVSCPSYVSHAMFHATVFSKRHEKKGKKLAVDSFSIMLYSSILYRIFINRKHQFVPFYMSGAANS